MSQPSILLSVKHEVSQSVAVAKTHSSIRSILKKKSNWPAISEEREDEEESTTSSTIFSTSASSIHHGSLSTVVDEYDGTWEEESNGFDAPRSKNRNGELPASIGTLHKVHRSARFDLDDIQVIYVPKCTAEDWPLLYYDDDEIGEFRHQKFLEEIEQALNEQTIVDLEK